MSEDKADQKAEAKPKSGARALEILIGLTTIFVVIGSSILIYVSTFGYVPKTITEKDVYSAFTVDRTTSVQDPPVFMLEPLSVNLSGQPAKSVQIQVALHMLDETGFEEVGSYVAQTQDHILRIVGDSTFEDLQSIQGKLFLKQKLSSAINSILAKGVVKDVYFAQFVVR